MSDDDTKAELERLPWRFAMLLAMRRTSSRVSRFRTPWSLLKIEAGPFWNSTEPKSTPNVILCRAAGPPYVPVVHRHR
jgi:hypothetical protein